MWLCLCVLEEVLDEGYPRRHGIVIVHAVVGQVLSRGDVGDGEDVRTRHRCVVVFGSSSEHSPSLDLIIATCRVFRHLRTLEKTDDPRTQLALPRF